MAKTMRILFFGDLVGKPGRKAVADVLLDFKPKYNPDVIIANVENTTHGFGIIRKHFDELSQLGIHIMTSGNHIWDQKEAVELLDKRQDVILRPANYPSYLNDPCPGTGITYYTFSDKAPPLCVVNLMGRVFMDPLDCPFQFLEQTLPEIQAKTPLIFIDFHAQATSEKMAMAHYFDGELSALVGTHTHVQTSDEQIFPNGTAYISDVGICGSHFSVIGMQPMESIFRLRMKRPARFKIAEENIMVDAVVIDIDIETGKAHAIERINLKV